MDAGRRTQDAGRRTQDAGRVGRRFAAAPFLLLLALTACDNRTVAPSDDAMSPTFNTAGQPGASGLVRTLDDEFSDLAGEVPGFGGLYYDDDGTLTVRLKDTGRADAARSPVSAFLVRQAGRSPARLGQIPGEVGAMRAIAARYDFRELRAWYTGQVIPSLGATDGVTMTDIDERRNRIVIGVRDLSTGGAITTRLSGLGIPADAVEIVPFEGAVARPAVVQSDPECDPETAIEPCEGGGGGGGGGTSFSITSTRRPVPGGMQIQFFLGGQPFNCTLGYNARPDAGSNPARYFLTNSHCTDNFGVVTQMPMGQSSTAEQIGTELVDPPTFTSAADPACPAGRQCRYSDAALFVYGTSANSDHGRVAIPPVGSLTASVFGTVFSYGNAVMGQTVQKVGRTTGNTVGTVQQTCAMFNQFEENQFGQLFDTGRTMLCQFQATYSCLKGDSGGPVFFGIGGNDIFAVGLNWGSGCVFSPITAVAAEIEDIPAGFGINITGS